MLIICLIACLMSCRSTKYVANGEYLLKKNIIEINTGKINKDELELYLKQHPNKTSIFMSKFGLGIYNMSANNDKKINKWLRKIGEAPVIFDESLLEKSKSNLKEYVRQLGYYTSDITDTIRYKNKKAVVVYRINVQKPLRIVSMVYDIADTAVSRYVFDDTINTKINKGSILSNANLEAERRRIVSNLHKYGFYDFNNTFITFKADSTKGVDSVRVKMIIESPTKISDNGQREQTHHKRYVIGDVFINTRYDGARAMTNKNYMTQFDTIKTDDGINLIYRREQNIDKKLFKRINLINPGEIYNEQNINQTYNNITNLNLFRTARIDFSPSQTANADGTYNLTCNIYLTPMTLQGYSLGFEISTNSSGLIGFSPSVGYTHRNLFKGAEKFEISFTSMLQRKIPQKEGYTKSTEFGVNTSLNLPRFLIPIKIGYFKKHIPHTKFSASYLYQNRTYYSRTILGTSLGYLWKTSDYVNYTLNLIDLNVVNITKMDQDFYNRIKDPYVRSLYENHFALGANISFVHTDQRATYKKFTHYFRVNVDFAGNTLSLLNPLMKKDSENKHLLFNTRYAQYARIDATLTFNKKLNDKNTFASRFYAGIGRAYGNSLTMPLEKMFYSGGANSLRGWQVRTVGPGSAERDTIFTIPNQVGDFKLEFNAEWRFKIAWLLEGAMFFDAGNIWSLNPNDTREKAKFKFDTFFKTIATSAGVGARLNLGIFTFRVDWGFKIHDPILPEHRFVKIKNWFKNGNNALHWGINYPF